MLKKLPRLLAPLCLAAVFLIFGYGSDARAEAQEDSGFTGSLSSTRGRPDAEIELRVEYSGSPEKIAAFSLELEFAGCWALQDTRFCQNGYFSQNGGTGSAYVVYALQDDQELAAGQVLAFRFRLQETLAGQKDFSLRFRYITAKGQPGSNSLTLSYQVLPPPSSDARILRLTPSAGSLVPDFSPEITEYELTVPFSVTEMSFEAEIPEGAAQRVNRKNLGAGGSTTGFTLTVTAADGSTKGVYTIAVYREEKPVSTPTPIPTPKPTNTPKPTATPKPTSTPKPSATPKPANTPKPTATPKPTNTPKPSATPKPVQTPKPSASPKAAAGTGAGPSPSPDGEQPQTVVVRTVELQNGTEPSTWQMGFAIMTVIAALAVLKPLAERVGDALPGKEVKKESEHSAKDGKEQD